MSLKSGILIIALAILLIPSAARADAYLSPFLGVNFGGEVGTPLGSAISDRNRLTWGGSVGSMAGGIFGIDLDFGYTTKFYADTTGLLTKNNVLTLMPAVTLGIPVGGQTGVGVRPYALAGVGLIRRDIEFSNGNSISENDMGYTLGGGLMIFFSDSFGIRGDVRYLRNFKIDELSLTGVSFERGTFNFGRATAGAVFRF